jgi:maltose alpha-D-glucosyltransferase / alpha-amylase
MIIYQLYIDKFNKNIKGLIDKLDYLVDLGVDTIWILPHYPSPMADGGYDVSDYENIREGLGSLDDFKQLTKSAHEKNLKIIIDMVLNHTSTEHPWFKTSRSSENNDKRDFYIWSDTSTDMLTSVNAFPNIKLSNWVYNPFTNDYYFATFYTLQPDLNWDNPQVFNNFLHIMDFWISLGVDGFRLDAMTHLIKRRHTLSIALPETHLIVNKIRNYIDSKYKDIMLIGEADMHTYKAKEYFGSGDECNYLYDFEGSTKLLLFIFNNNQNLIDEILHNYANKPKNSEWIFFLGSHDTINTELLKQTEKEELTQKLDPAGRFMKSHDKRIALRVSDMFNGDSGRIAYAFSILMALPGDKVIYYGDEMGMRNDKSQEFLIDNRFEVRGNFDWTELENQKNYQYSTYNRVKDILKKAKVRV